MENATTQPVSGKPVLITPPFLPPFLSNMWLHDMHQFNAISKMQQKHLEQLERSKKKAEPTKELTPEPSANDPVLTALLQQLEYTKTAPTTAKTPQVAAVQEVASSGGGNDPRALVLVVLVVVGGGIWYFVNSQKKTRRRGGGSTHVESD